MHILAKFKCKFRHSLVKKLWHRFAPPFVIKRTVWEKKIFFNLRDNIDDVTRSMRELENREPNVLALLELTKGAVWDVGANVGLFSIRSALLGHSTTAFELSSASLKLLKKMVQVNNLTVKVVDQAMTVNPMRYNPPNTSYTENQICANSEGSAESISFKDAASLYGIPTLLKMDIEGFEETFFKSEEFKE